MSTQETDTILTNAGHTRYQSIGPSETEEQHKKSKNKFAAILLISLATVLFGGVVVCGMVTGNEQAPVYNNGTHDFAPTVIFISLDGVVNHDLDLHLTPVLSGIAEKGVRAEYMIPSFPPITFPNHWSLVTGLYPEAHGIIGNDFYDAELNDTFYYKTPDKSWDSKWWGGEPIWITAVQQNKKAGVIMWPGCSTDFNGKRPTYTVAFNDNIKFDDKVSQVFDWLNLPIEERPQFVGLYVQQVDQAGHKYGPYANQTLTQLKLADQSIGNLMKGLQERNLTDIVNIIVVSDHGMSTTDPSRTIKYGEFLTAEELALIWRIELIPSLGIRTHPSVNQDMAVEILYQAFRRLHNSLETPHFEVYKREDFPSRFHFRDNHRIPPLIVLPDAGWTFTLHKNDFMSKGMHGYDNLSPESRAIFVAHGPGFPKGETIEPFWNVELYNVMARILHLKPSENNNTLNGLLKVA